MITVPEATKKIVERSRFLTEAMSKGLINYSSLARYIKPELERMLLKSVSEASILMSLRRLEREFQPKFQPLNIFASIPEITVRSNLFGITLSNSSRLDIYIKEFLILNINDKSSFFVLSKGINETTYFASNNLHTFFNEILKNEKPIASFERLCSITISLPKESVKTPGVYYFFLKSLAWEGINIIDLISTFSELTLIFGEKEVHDAFRVIRSLFEK